MPQMNLNMLSPQELRQRLDASRARGDATVAYEILQEMAARRSAEPEKRPPFGKRRKGEPHLVEIAFDDPLEKADDLPPMPNWRPPGAAAPEAPAAEPQSPPKRAPKPEPLGLRLVEPSAPVTPTSDAVDFGPLRPAAEAPPPEPPQAPPAKPPRERRPQRRFAVAAGFAVGIGAGLAMGWFGADYLNTPAPAATAVQTAVPTVPPPPMAETLDVAVADPAPAAPEAPPPEPVGDLPPDFQPGAVASPDEEPAVEAPATPQPTELAEAQPEKLPAATTCERAPTPADREICADPDLQRLQRDLRRAYAAALDAHEDRATLRQRQLAWRDGRNDVTDPDRLARLYQQRIAKLNAATAEARAAR